MTSFSQNRHSILSSNLENNIHLVEEAMTYTEDLTKRYLTIDNKKMIILYISSLVDKVALANEVIQPLLKSQNSPVQELIYAPDYEKTNFLQNVVLGLLDGNSVLLMENDVEAVLIPLPTTDDRAIEEPSGEKLIKGAHDGFTESAEKNIFLIRRRIKNPNLRVQNFVIGKATRTDVKVIYLDNLVNPTILAELKRRISNIKVDELLSGGELEELIEDNSYSPFPQLLTTERPDRATSYLLEGKIAVIVNGTPSAILLPVTFISYYQSPDHYNSRWIIGSFFRILSFISFLISISLPAIYIATVTFHSDILPLWILYSIKVQIQFLPLTPFMEAVLMQLTLELLKEAAIRLPSPIAQTIGIVGGLVIGTAVVEAGFISNTMIVVIGLTAISSFVAPTNQIGTAARFISFPIMIAANLFGFVGIVLALTVLSIHLCKLHSFGESYLYPFSPLDLKGLKDSFYRGKKDMNP
ncbi:spore germination protein [Guptibacillus hwajinpoensis]|uniref:spore germination protein n=1 Tax=Guptibacillus hwajinpoensis TaxID=208199 RepID=UPI00136D1784|nr:spore germination protein [Pseudalkalibacillus hwajinpoensis]